MLGGVVEQQAVEDVGEVSPACTDGKAHAGSILLEQLFVGRPVPLHHLVQAVQNASLQLSGNDLDAAVFLNRLARDVQADVARVHNPLHKTQVAGQKRRARLVDKHTRAVQAKPVVKVFGEKLRVRLGRHKEHGVVLNSATCPRPDAAQGILRVAELEAIEVVLLFLAHGILGQRPDGRH